MLIDNLSCLTTRNSMCGGVLYDSFVRFSSSFYFPLLILQFIFDCTYDRFRWLFSRFKHNDSNDTKNIETKLSSHRFRS